MGILPNQNVTDVPIQLQMAPWKSASYTPETYSNPQTATNIMIVLGVLTFVVQLCLALNFLLRCWRLDKKIQKDKHTAERLCTDTLQLSPYVSHQPVYHLSSPGGLSEEFEYSETLNGHYKHWDLVQ